MYHESGPIRGTNNVLSSPILPKQGLNLSKDTLFVEVDIVTPDILHAI